MALTILITGGAGFIGSHTIKKILYEGHHVVCIDNFNDYYDVSLKEDRISKFLGDYQFPVERIDICDMNSLKKVFKKYTIDSICHLAARAGVRDSLKNPLLFEKVNILGTLNLLQLAVEYKISNFVFASSSSVYGNNKKLPFSEKDFVDHPISPYAATKKAGELLTYTYHHIYQMPITCLRFFTVYGPWGRPDMAIFKFTDRIVAKKPIQVYNYGNMKRNFTYIDDIVEGVWRSLESKLPYEIINLGNDKTEELLNMIKIIEKGMNIKAKKELLPLQPGDVPITFADIEKARTLLNFKPRTNIQEGIMKFLDWYRVYYHKTTN